MGGYTTTISESNTRAEHSTTWQIEVGRILLGELLQGAANFAVAAGTITAFWFYRRDLSARTLASSLEWDRYLKETRDAILADGLDRRRLAEHLNRVELVCAALRAGSFRGIAREHLIDLVRNDLAGLQFLAARDADTAAMVAESVTSQDTYVDVAWFHGRERAEIDRRCAALGAIPAAGG